MSATSDHVPAKPPWPASMRIGLRLLPVGVVSLIGGASLFDPSDPWTHPTWFMTMGGLATWAALLLVLASVMFRRKQREDSDQV